MKSALKKRCSLRASNRDAPTDEIGRLCADLVPHSAGSSVWARPHPGAALKREAMKLARTPAESAFCVSVLDGAAAFYR